jgi:hypothetical protein
MLVDQDDRHLEAFLAECVHESLNNYQLPNAVFLCERLHAACPTEVRYIHVCFFSSFFPPELGIRHPREERYLPDFEKGFGRRERAALATGSAPRRAMRLETTPRRQGVESHLRFNASRAHGDGVNLSHRRLRLGAFQGYLRHPSCGV